MSHSSNGRTYSKLEVHPILYGLDNPRAFTIKRHHRISGTIEQVISSSVSDCGADDSAKLQVFAVMFIHEEWFYWME